MPDRSPFSSPSDQRPASVRRRRRRALALLAALALAGGVAACGSGDDDGGRERQPLSTDAYLQQINAAQSRFAGDAAKLDLATPASARDFGQSLGQLNGLIDRLRRRLDGLAAPDAVTRQQDELVEQLRDYGRAIGRQRGALTSGDPERARAAARKVGRASTTFSRDFDATIAKINENLGLDAASGG